MKQVLVLIVIGLLLSACGASSNSAVGRLRAKAEGQAAAQPAAPTSEATTAPAIAVPPTVVPDLPVAQVAAAAPIDDAANFWALIALVLLGFALGWLAKTITITPAAKPNQEVKRG